MLKASALIFMLFSNFILWCRNISVIQISYLLFFIGLPFIYVEDSIDPVLIPRQTYLSVFLAFIWIVLLFKKRNYLKPSLIGKLSWLILVIGFLFISNALLSSVFAHVVSESLYVNSKYCISYLFFITTYFLITANLIFKRDLILSVYLFFIISLGLGISDLLDLFSNNLNVLSNSTLITATYANKNLFASILILCFWTIFLQHKNLVIKAVITFVFLILLVLLQSKIVLFVFILISVALLVFQFKTNKKISSKKFQLLIFSLVTVASCVFLFNISKFENLANIHTLKLRLALWQNSVQMIKEFPFGVGSGNWQIYFPKYGLAHFDLDTVQLGLMTFQRPHNDFFWVLCELGIQGLILYLCFFALVIYVAVKLLKTTKSLLSFLLLISIISYLLIAFFDFPLERVEHQILLAVILVITINAFDSTVKKTKTFFHLKWIPFFFVFIGLSLVVCFYRLKGEYYTQQFISLDKKTNPDIVIEKAELSKSLFYEIDVSSMPIDWHIAKAQLYKNKFHEAKVKALNANKIAPYNIKVLENLGYSFYWCGDTLGATNCFVKVLGISPSFTFKLK